MLFEPAEQIIQREQAMAQLADVGMGMGESAGAGQVWHRGWPVLLPHES